MYLTIVKIYSSVETVRHYRNNASYFYICIILVGPLNLYKFIVTGKLTENLRSLSPPTGAQTAGMSTRMQKVHPIKINHCLFCKS